MLRFALNGGGKSQGLFLSQSILRRQGYDTMLGPLPEAACARFSPSPRSETFVRDRVVWDVTSDGGLSPTRVVPAQRIDEGVVHIRVVEGFDLDEINDADLRTRAPILGDWSAHFGYYAGLELLRFRDFSAVFASNDQMALGLLRAEAAYRMNNRAEAASLINVTRTAAGLNATDAAGTNTDCVPKLPDASCGDLFEMLKWEVRLETMYKGLHLAPWYFHGRGWGDLAEGTFLQRPLPGREAELLFVKVP